MRTPGACSCVRAFVGRHKQLAIQQIDARVAYQHPPHVCTYYTKSGGKCMHMHMGSPLCKLPSYYLTLLCKLASYYLFLNYYSF
jgi:hypothetical protein